MTLHDLTTPRPRDEWTESDGSVLWWDETDQEPYCGMPTDNNWPWFTIVVPICWTPLPEVKR